MYEDDINALIQKCKRLKHFFRGVFAADNFPLHLPEGNFIIVNASKQNTEGTHWLLFYNHRGSYVFADPLGFPLENYKAVNQHLRGSWEVSAVFEINKLKPLQRPNSKSCGLFCIYIAHVIKSSSYDLPFSVMLINENDLARFVKHML